MKMPLFRVVACAGLVVALATSEVAAQEKPKAAVPLRDVLLQGWNEIGDKVVQLAENFPEEKYEFKPVDGVRTFADTLRHVAFWNDWVARTARGEKVDGKPNELPKAEYQTKTQVVAALKKHTAAAAAQLKNGSEPVGEAAGLWMSFIAHSSEHYGQLVVYYRLNGLVPPVSRGR
jgi:uncharacterized damage-inducible protein DinB